METAPGIPDGSREGQALVPEIRFPGAKAYIGLPEGRKEVPLEAACYHIRERLALVTDREG